MGDFFKTLKFRLIICMTALLTGFMLCSAVSEGSFFSGENLINIISNPAKKYIATSTNSFSEKINAIVNSSEYKKENQKLREEISELRNKLTEYENTKTELEELRKFMGIKEQHQDLKLSAPCTVISRTANDIYCSFMIDKGSKDGISLYDPVVTSEGLVGIITEISETYSAVETILSPGIAIGSICPQTNDTGIVQGSVSNATEGLCEMIYIDRNNNLETGSIITTSGAGGRFPKNYLIGTIKEIKSDDSGLSSYAVIEPFVNISEVSAVMVITEFTGQESYDEQD